MKNETRKHAFEIKAWADGWGILCYNSLEWFDMKQTSPEWLNQNNYVINDAYFEFRKAEKEGKTIEIKRTADRWEKIEMSNVQPIDYVDAAFRIKPEKITIEFDKKDVIEAITEHYQGMDKPNYNLKVSKKMYNQIINKLK